MKNTNTYLIDTSAWIPVYRRRPQETIAERIRALIRANLASANEVVQMEILLGCRTREEFDAAKASLEGLRWLAVRRETWQGAAELGYSLRRKGLIFAVPDLLIARSAIDHDAVLLHADSDFDRIAANSDLRVESYAEAAT